MGLGIFASGSMMYTLLVLSFLAPTTSFLIQARNWNQPKSAFSSVRSRIEHKARHQLKIQQKSTDNTVTASKDDSGFPKNPLETFLGLLSSFGGFSQNNNEFTTEKIVALSYLKALIERRDVTAAMSNIASTCEVIDTEFYNPILGKDAIQRHLYLILNTSIIPDDAKVVVDGIVTQNENKVSIMYHLEKTTGKMNSGTETVVIPCSTIIAIFEMDDNNVISSIFSVKEPKDPKPGDSGLKLLKKAASFLEILDTNKDDDSVNLTSAENKDNSENNNAETTQMTIKNSTQEFEVTDDTDSDIPPYSSLEEISEDQQIRDDINEKAKDIENSAVTGALGEDSRNTVLEYYSSWNRRDMESASKCFVEDCEYNDMQYPNAFQGRDALENHLKQFSDVFPPTFRFIVDNIVAGNDDESNLSSSGQNQVAVQWHFENNDEQLPFTRGASFYTTSGPNGQKLISSGVDIPEPPVIKPGSVSLVIDTLQRSLQKDPKRVIPLITWITYVYVVFFSNGILPGADALQLETRTWEEVRDLSLNFFLVSPLLHLPFAPVVHPMLEGIFNLLLSWAAMFAMFLSDEREDKPNLLDMRPILVGMQFLTSAFLLPYLVFRTEEKENQAEMIVYREDIKSHEIAAKIGEWRPLGLSLGAVGTGSIIWGLFARYDQFGDITERYASLLDLLSIDRVGSSFVVDLIIFGLFQGWFIDDDMKRRGIDVEAGEMTILRNVAKFVPFFGLVAYSSLRPNLPSKTEEGA